MIQTNSQNNIGQALNLSGIKLLKLTGIRRLESTLVSAVVLFLFKLIFPEISSPLLLVLNEALIFMTFYFAVLYLFDFIQQRKYTPLSLILNAGILNAIIFFVLSALSGVFSGIFEELTPDNFMYSIIICFYAFIFIAALAYIFAVFKNLFFLKQKKNQRFYFNTMLFFLFLTSLASDIQYTNPHEDYLVSSFLTVTILLITINSIRISWIAFLVKKEKFYLLIISIVLVILFGMNIGYSGTGDGANIALMRFSPMLYQFLNTMMIYGTIFFSIIFFTTLFHLPTAEVFDRKAQEVSSLMDLTRLITQVFDFKELADTVTDITTKVCNSDSAWLVSKEQGEMAVSAVKNIGYVEADKITTLLTANFDLQNTDGIKSYSAAQIKQYAGSSGSLADFCSLAISPLKVHNYVSGYLIAGRKSEMVFDDDDMRAIGTFADYAAIAIENAKLLKESLEKERMEKELDVAREIQYKILPDKTPVYPSLEISAVFIPAFEVGGDYYDFFKLGEDKLGFVIADVSGKGISAAFIMAEVKGIFESLSKLIQSPKEVLIKANEILKNSLEKKNFVTVVYGVLDLGESAVYLSRGGHPPIMLVRDGRAEYYRPNGLGLGLDYSCNFANSIEEIKIKLKENDILLLYTDGIPESKNSQLEDFGEDRLEQIVLSNSFLSLDELSNKIMKEVTTFSQGSPQHDDITMVILKWKTN